VEFEMEARRRDRRGIPHSEDSVRNGGAFLLRQKPARMLALPGRTPASEGGRYTWNLDAGNSLVAPLGGVDVVEGERLFVESGGAAIALVLPGGDVGVVLVVAKRFAFGRLKLFAEVTTAGFVAV
jgi:hypothetical protein